MRSFAFFLPGLLLSLCSYAQVIAGEDPACGEKCSRAYLPGMLDQVNYFQYPVMNKYNIKYLKLDLNIEANSRVIAGSALIRARAIQLLDSFVIELRDNMIVDSIRVNGVLFTFQRGSDHVFIPVSSPLSPGSLFDVLIYYHGTASSAAVYAGNQTSLGFVYTATVSESYQAREWYPAKQFLSDKIDSSDIWITTDAANLVGSNGRLAAIIELPGNKKQFRWKTNYPENYYMPSLAVANYMEYRNYAKPPAMSPDSILILHYIANNLSYFNSNKANLDKTPAFVEKESELFGLYPFKNEKYGHSQANIGGGMEHQTMSTMSGFSPEVIAHELAHQWFGDHVTCATWNDIWLNEGFASYAEYLMMEKLPALFSTTSSAFMQSEHDNALSQTGGSVFVPNASVFDENRIFNTRLSYDKGSAIIHTLRFEMQNDNLFFQTLKNYQQQFKDSVATANDFKTVAEVTSGKSFTDFFNQWYYGEGYPTINVDFFKQTDSIVLTLNQSVSAPAITPFFKGLYEFTIHTTQGDTTVRVYQTINNQVFKFLSNRIPTGIVVDPNNWVLNKVGVITAITDLDNVSGKVILFPNPATSNIVLKYPMNWFDNLQLFDAYGKMLMSLPVQRGTVQQTINPSLQNGIYFVRLNGKGRMALKKLLIAR